MSNEITTARVQRYTDGITLLAQQRESRLRNKLRVETGIKAKIEFYDQVGITQMVERTTRHGDTPIIEIPHRRRAVVLKFFHTADLIDTADLNEVLNDPAGTYGQAMASAAGRTIDQTIIDNAIASARTGEDGLTMTPFNTSDFTVLQTHDPDTEGQGLQTAKILRAKKILDEAENDVNMKRPFVTNARGIEDLLRNTKYTNSDYASVKALAKGEATMWAGFDFCRVELLRFSSGVIRSNLAWVERCQLLGIGIDIVGRVSERDDKDYSTQIYYSMRVGATRMDETGTVEVRVNEA